MAVSALPATRSSSRMMNRSAAAILSSPSPTKHNNAVLTTPTTTPTTAHKQRPQRPQQDCLLQCRCEAPKSFVTLLQSLQVSGSGTHNTKSSSNAASLSSGQQQPMTIYATPNGLTIQAHPNPQFQSSMELPASMFGSFHIAEDGDDNERESVEFCISWKTFLDCLAALTLEHPISLTLSYHASTEVLQIE
jgi:hypothetical protein